jgi:hypothetical protein
LRDIQNSFASPTAKFYMRAFACVQSTAPK